MTVDRQTEIEIRRLFFAEHWKRGTIVTQLGVHSDVVDRVIGHLGPQPKHVEPRPSVLDPYHSFVLDTLQRYPGLVSTRIYDMLGERGYTGSLRTLRRFVQLHRPDVPREAGHVRIETLAGEQSQIDWAHVGRLRVEHVFEQNRPWMTALWFGVLLGFRTWHCFAGGKGQGQSRGLAWRRCSRSGTTWLRKRACGPLIAQGRRQRPTSEGATPREMKTSR